MKPSRIEEQQAAERLVALLVARHQLPLDIVAVFVADDWKTLFTFNPHPVSEKWTLITLSKKCPPRSKRYARGIGVGIEVDWLKRYGDIDSWQWNNDFLSLFMHGIQLLGRFFTRKEVRPSKLLRRVEREIAKESKNVSRPVGEQAG